MISRHSGEGTRAQSRDSIKRLSRSHIQHDKIYDKKDERSPEIR